MSKEMISFPRELSDDLAEFIAEKARVCGGGADEIWEALCERFGQPAEQPTQKYDDTLLPFMELMRRELHANSHKGDRHGWMQMDIAQAVGEIRHHVSKLDSATLRHDESQIVEYAADVANCCMMLLDTCGVLAFVEKDAPVAAPDAPECRCKRYGKDNPHWPCPVHSAVAEQHQGEPVDWAATKPVSTGAYWIRGNGLEREALIEVVEDDGELRCNLHQRTTESDFGYGYSIEQLSDEFEWRGPLYTHPGAQPAAVALPEQKTTDNLTYAPESRSFVCGWNACLDEVARLNPPQR